MTILAPAPEPIAVEDADHTAPDLRAAAATESRSDGRHTHSLRCYWDFRECRWVCAPS